MNLFDPTRSQINNFPTLLGRKVVVPRLCLWPVDTDTVQVSAMVPWGSVSRQVTRIVNDTEVPRILAAYRDDPENTLETLFTINLSTITEPSDRELARDLKREYERENNEPEERAKLTTRDKIAAIVL